MTLKYIIGMFAIFIILAQPFASANQASYPSLTKHLVLPPDGSRTDAFHMVVIGDSVAWGNGLNDEDKYYYLVADWLQKELNRTIDVSVYAHSGATISGEPGKSIDPNLNSGYPTLMDQAYNIVNKDEVDLILASGGINDVGVWNIMNPWVSSEDIGQRAESTKTTMGILFAYLLDKCNNTKIVVTNYYPIVSEDSDTKLIMGAYDLGILAVNAAVKKDTLDGATAKERLTENSAKFHDGSTNAIINAISDSGDDANRIVLANISFKSKNSYAASETWLWKLIAPQASMISILKTDDDQFDFRSSLATDPIDKINAVGHPNRDGAREYARAIESAIESKGVDWLQNEIVLNQKANNTQVSSFSIYSTKGSQTKNQPQIEWRKNFVGYTISPSICQTNDGGYIIASYSDSPSVRLIKTDHLGETIWDKELEAPEKEIDGRVDNVFSVRQMSDGGYNIFAKTHNLNGVFAWLIKTDSQGDIIWDETVEVQEIVSVLQMSDGGYVIETRLPNRQVGLMKIDSEGNKLWDMTLDDTLLDASDNVFENALDLFDETKEGGCIIAGNKGYNGTLLIKIDDQGNQLWNKLLSPLEPPIKPRMESVNSVQETSDGGFIIAGCKSGYDKDPSGIAYAYRGEHENTYGVLIKTDSSGNEIWSKTFNMCDEFHKQNNWTCIYSVRQTNDFGYILAGRTCDDNTWVIKTDSMGNVEWENLIWIFNGDVFNPSSILETNDGGYLIGGNANLHGIGMFKIGRNEDANITENNQIPLANKQEQQEINEKNKSEKTKSGIQEEKMTSEAPGFGGILAFAALVSIFIFRKKR